MKNTALFLIAGVAILTACNSEKTSNVTEDTIKSATTDTTTVVAEPAVAGNCYAYIKNNDTAYLKLDIRGEELTGDLTYKLFEKDSNKGTIAGEIKGDTIIAEYTFDSEGMRSVREVVFLKKDDKYYEGFGPVEEESGKMMFKDRKLLKFDNSIVFSPSACQ